MQKLFKSDIMPFKMYGNLYFVGSSRVSVHLIDTGSGLIMIDTGYPDMYEQIIDSIEFLGFAPEDICAIFHPHGHIDHFGCTREFKKLSGAKTYISRIDNDIVNGTYDLSWAREVGMEPLETFDCDVLIEDGDKSIIAAMHGGVGRNSMQADFLNRYNLSFDCREKFRAGLRKLTDERVDLVMGNHPQQNDTEGKLQKALAGECVLDCGEWKRFLALNEKKLDEMIDSEKIAAPHTA